MLGKEGTPFGWGLWNHRSNMPLRIVSHSLEDLDESFFDDAVPPCSDGKSTNSTPPFHPSPPPSNGTPKRPTPKANFLAIA